MAVAAWRKGIAEFIGAFTLIFIGAGAILTAGSTSTSDLLLVALAHGLAIGVMVSALAHVSGGHFNPAVTFGALVSRQISPRLAVVYWVAQLLGGLGGALALAGVFPASIWQPYHLGTPTLGNTVSLGWDVGIGTGILHSGAPVHRHGDQGDQGCHPHPPQRMPAAEAAAGVGAGFVRQGQFCIGKGDNTWREFGARSVGFAAGRE